MRFFTFRIRTVVFAAAMLAAVALASFGAYAADAAAVYWSAARSLPVYSVERTDSKIAISFDCAWGDEYTAQILSALDAANVRATFFTVQFWAEKYPEHLKTISEAGNEIGTHSATHSYMSRLSEGEIRAELTSSAEAISSVTGKEVTLFRPPYGDYDDLLVDTAADMGMLTVQWDVDSLDWKDLSAQEIAERILAQTKSGSIILCHNNGLHTAEALPIVLDALKARGFEFVPIGELVYRENFTIDRTGRQFSNGG